MQAQTITDWRRTLETMVYPADMPDVVVDPNEVFMRAVEVADMKNQRRAKLTAWADADVQAPMRGWVGRLGFTRWVLAQPFGWDIGVLNPGSRHAKRTMLGEDGHVYVANERWVKRSGDEVQLRDAVRLEPHHFKQGIEPRSVLRMLDRFAAA